MATLRPSKPDPIRFELRYILSKDGRENYVANTGSFPPSHFEMDIALPELTPELRRRGYNVYIRSLPTEEEIEAGVEDIPDEMFDPAMLYPALEAPTDDPDQVIAAWERWYAAADREEAQQAELRKARDAAEKILREAFRLEMASWIATHGSDRLKLAVERGYKVSTDYVRERAQKEFPGFDVDTQSKLKWGERTNPSEAALKHESATLQRAAGLGHSYEIRIAWLVRDLEGKALIGKDKREVIVVPKYLTFYTLVADAIDPDEVPF